MALEQPNNQPQPMAQRPPVCDGGEAMPNKGDAMPNQQAQGQDQGAAGPGQEDQPLAERDGAVLHENGQRREKEDPQAGQGHPWLQLLFPLQVPQGHHAPGPHLPLHGHDLHL